MNDDATRGSDFVYVGGDWRPKSEHVEPVRPESAGSVHNLDQMVEFLAQCSVAHHYPSS
jgi:hypothetical protein